MEIDNDNNNNNNLVTNWCNLPSVILYEIFSYLSANERIKASSACKRWRNNLFYQSFWKNVQFVFKRGEKRDKNKIHFLRAVLCPKVTNASILFNSLDPVCTEMASKVLHALSDNTHLKRITLSPSHCRLYPFSHHLHPERRIVFQLCNIIEKQIYLEVFSVGCLEEISNHNDEFLRLIVKKHHNTIRVLGLASLKYDPDDYILPYFDIKLFTHFTHLEIVSVDYDILEDEFLYIIKCLNISRLIIHIHGVTSDHPGITDKAWSDLRTSCPKLEVRMNIIHAFDVVRTLETTIFRPSIPLSHLRVFFCEQLNEEALNYLIVYAATLKSLWWVDSFDSPQSYTIVSPGLTTAQHVYLFEHVNPFVLTAWRCINLKEFVLFGYKYLAEDIFAISRLRGHDLKKMQLAVNDMIFTTDTHLELVEIEQEASNWIGWDWKALRNDELHPVILRRTNGASDEYILPVVLSDLVD